MPGSTAILLISALDRAGIVAGVSNLLYTSGCNLITSAQHSEPEDGQFFWRLELDSQRLALTELATVLRDNLGRTFPGLGMTWRLYDDAARDRTVIMVSKLAHCMIDLLSRHHAGELDARIVAIVSNHPDLAPLAQPFGVPFEVIAITREIRAGAEARLLALLRRLNCDTVVLARYMQVLSPDFLRAWGKPIVNIHHSFLPAFVGARPHKQARDRGVKLIGATAHYVTEELDAGPIIAQATTPVTHRDSVTELARKGRDVEVEVLARAVRAHLQRRVMIHRNRTIVFD